MFNLIIVVFKYYNNYIKRLVTILVFIGDRTIYRLTTWQSLMNKSYDDILLHTFITSVSVFLCGDVSIIV